MGMSNGDVNVISISDLVLEGNLVLKHITDLYYSCAINTHGVLSVSGILEKELRNDSTGENIKVSIRSNSRNEVLFDGYIAETKQEFQAGLWYITIIAYTESWLFDLENKFRAFQSKDQSLKDLLKYLTGAKITVSNKLKNNYINQMYIQYDETDWQFIKRIAAQMNAFVIPSIHKHGDIAHIGNKSNKLSEVINEVYKKRLDLELYRKRKELSTCSMTDFYQYTIKCHDYSLDLGDELLAIGKGWIVAGKTMQLNKGLVVFNYKICRTNVIVEPSYNNFLIQGKSLEGCVLNVEEERLQVCLDISVDENKTSLFPVTYLPATSNIMYSLPEINSKVMIYFPSADESDAIAVNAVMEECEYPSSDNKSLITAQKKEINVSDQGINIVGSEQKNVFELWDTKGVSFISDNSIKINAKKGIVFNSYSGIYANTNEDYQLENIPSKDKIIISGKEMIYETKHAELSGYLNPYESRINSAVNLNGINQSAKYANNVVGAIPFGYELNIALVMGAIPTCMGISKDEKNIELVFIGRR